MRQFAQRANISRTSVSDVISESRPPTFEFCVAIAAPLGESPIKLFQRAGLISGKDENDLTYSELEELVTQLTEEQRLEVVRYVKFLLWQKMTGGE